MPMGSGLDLLKWVRGKGLESEFIFLTCHESFAYASEAIEYRAGSYIVKPFDEKKMSAAIEKSLLNIRRREYLAYYDQYGRYLLKEKEEREESFWRGVLFSRFSGSQLQEGLLKDHGLAPDEKRTLVLVRLSRCCNPVPGDEIIGFVTRGRGVSVHRADCPNAEDLKRDPERIIDVEWESEPAPNTSYQVEVLVEALDRMNLLLDVTTVISGMGANLISSSLNVHRDGMADMRFLFQVSDIGTIDQMLSKLQAVEGVFEARRMLPGEGARKKSK